MKVTPKDIQQVARQVINFNKLNLVIIGPFKEDKKFKKIISDFNSSL